MNTPKETVICEVTMNGQKTNSFRERRAVYTDKYGKRYIKILGRRYPLDVFNTYQYAYTSIPAQRDPTGED